MKVYLRQLSKFAPSGILLLSNTAGLIQLSYTQDPAMLAEAILDRYYKDRRSAAKAMKKRLSEYFSLNRRYSRSINVERDLELPNTVLGYVLTDKSVNALRRILAAFTGNHPTRAWTLTVSMAQESLPCPLFGICVCYPNQSNANASTGDCQECTRLG